MPETYPPGPHDPPGPLDPPAPHDPPEETLIATARGALAEMPARPRRALVLQLAALVALSAWSTWTAADLRSPLHWATMVSYAGLGLWLVAATLHRVGQPTGSCSPWKMTLESSLLSRVHRILPTLAMLAATLVAIAIGIALPVAAERPLVLVFPALLAILLVFVLRTITATTGFLFRHAHEQAEAAAAARAEAADATLAALQAQTQPHFLFNALNTVASLIRTDPVAAEATVLNLSRILRRTLDRGRKPLSTLSDELEFVRAYLAIEQERLGDRLQLKWSIAPETLAARVPTMSLQPLVENAIKHAIANRIDGGRIQLTARQEQGRLILEVVDDGPGFATEGRKGTGLANLRQRLTTLYGQAASLAVVSVPGSTTVAVELPVTTAATVSIA